MRAQEANARIALNVPGGTASRGSTRKDVPASGASISAVPSPSVFTRLDLQRARKQLPSGRSYAKDLQEERTRRRLSMFRAYRAIAAWWLTRWLDGLTMNYGLRRARRRERAAIWKSVE